MSEQNMVKVRKYFGRFPETIRMRGVNVQFNENGLAEVPEHVAEFLRTSLPHEYIVADAEGNFPVQASEVSEEPKRKVVTDEERDMRGELARLRVEAQQIPAMAEEINRLNEENAKLAEENAALRAELEAAAKAPEASEAPAAPAAPTPPAAPAPRKPAGGKTAAANK